jgi:DNA-binding LacI/PurR family transcriptional regulator
VDCFRWSSQITKHLIDHGRRKIFYISGPLSLRHEQDRLEGYKKGLQDHGIEVKEDLIVTQDFQSGSAYHAVKQVLEQGVDFDAIQASNDQAAIGAIKALMEAGIITLPGVVGEADAAVTAYLNGNLNFNPNTVCAHHAHGEGHTCGDHGCGSHGCGGHCH